MVAVVVVVVVAGEGAGGGRARGRPVLLPALVDRERLVPATVAGRGVAGREGAGTDQDQGGGRAAGQEGRAAGPGGSTSRGRRDGEGLPDGGAGGAGGWSAGGAGGVASCAAGSHLLPLVAPIGAVSPSGRCGALSGVVFSGTGISHLVLAVLVASRARLGPGWALPVRFL